MIEKQKYLKIDIVTPEETQNNISSENVNTEENVAFNQGIQEETPAFEPQKDQNVTEQVNPQPEQHETNIFDDYSV